jgi:hypothetical protein
MAFFDQGHRRHDLAGRTEAALETVMVDEGLLDRVQRIAVRQPLDGRDLTAVDGGGKHHAGIHPPAIEVDGAGAALAEIAALLGAGEAEPLAQGVEQGDACVHRQAMLVPVDADRNVDLVAKIHVAVLRSLRAGRLPQRRRGRRLRRQPPAGRYGSK